MSSTQLSAYSASTLLQNLALLKGSLSSLLWDLPSSAWVDNPDMTSYQSEKIEQLIDLGVVGIWESASFGKVIWVKIFADLPLYRPVAVIYGNQRARFISQSEYRAVVLGLNNALLQLEGFE